MKVGDERIALKVGFYLGEPDVYIRISTINLNPDSFHSWEPIMSVSNPVAENIKHSITKNGFPGKVVRLPFKPVYDSCKKNGTVLADVLDHLKGEDILGAMEGDYIVFRSPEQVGASVQAKQAAPQESSGAEDSSWWSKLSGLGDVSSMAKDAMAKMTPEQLAEIKNRVANMSDEEKKNILKMMSQFSNPFKGK